MTFLTLLLLTTQKCVGVQNYIVYSIIVLHEVWQCLTTVVNRQDSMRAVLLCSVPKRNLSNIYQKISNLNILLL